MLSHTSFPAEPRNPNESSLINEMVEATIAKQESEHKKGTIARRDVHAKSHGTVHAEFRILDNIPADLRVGVFARPASYNARVRFSNGANLIDILPNVRGIAIKLEGVDGAKLLPGDETSREHDFLLANDRRFFVDSIENMLLLVKGQMSTLAKTAPKLLYYMARAMIKLVKNPLHIDYFSQVPYLCGEQAVHYALIANESSSFLALPNAFDRDYLRHAVEKRLRKGPVKMSFCVQRQNPGDLIEDSSKPWTGKLIPVAELTFLPVSTPILESEGEELSFNPYRVLAEHEPLSWVGRARKQVYAVDFDWRTKVNLG